MKNTDDGEPSTHVVLVALLITFLAIAAFLIPSPLAVEAPSEIHTFYLAEIALASEIDVEVILNKPVLRTELTRVCSCESTGSPDYDPVLYHYEDDGVTLLIGRVNPADRGMCQINMDAHGDAIDAMGLDLKVWDDYITFTNGLYDAQGLAPWKYSKHCWQ